MALQSVSPISFESVSAVTASPSVELGTERKEGFISYIYSYNGGNSQISKGQYARLDAAALSSGVTVTVSNAVSQAGGEFIVGVAHNATFATGTYGWLATKGPVLVALDSGEVSMNSGDILVPGLNGGFVVAPATLSTSIHLAVALNSLVTTVGTGKALFKSPLFG